MSVLVPRAFVLKTGETCIVRSAEATDAEVLLAHGKAMTAEPFNVTTAEEFDFDLPQEEAWIEKHRATDGWLALVAEVDARGIGLLDFETIGRRRLQHRGTLGLGIARAWRGRGVGDALMKALIDWAAAHPTIEKISLAVIAGNDPAVALYEKHGFRVEGRCPRQIRREDGTYQDDLLMYCFVDAPSVR